LSNKGKSLSTKDTTKNIIIKNKKNKNKNKNKITVKSSFF